MVADQDVRKKDLIKLYDTIEDILEKHGFSVRKLDQKEKKEFRDGMYNLLVEQFYGKKSENRYRQDGY